MLLWNNKSNRKHYDFYFSSGNYDRRYPRANSNVLRTIRARLPASGHVIDFGCGSGRYLMALREHAAVVAGFDVSDSALAMLREHARGTQENSELYLLGPSESDLDRHVEEHGRADMVVCLFGVLSHIEGKEERRRVMRRFQDWLKPDTGQLVVSVPNRNRRFRAEQKSGTVGNDDEVSYVRDFADGSVQLTYKLFDTTTFRAELEDTGFALETVVAESLLPESIITKSRFLRAVDRALVPFLPATIGYGLLGVARPVPGLTEENSVKEKVCSPVTDRKKSFRGVSRVCVGPLLSILLLALVLVFLGGTNALAQPDNSEEYGRLERIKQRGRLIVGVKSDYPPWGMVSPKGRLIGLEPDLARDIAERLGVGVSLVGVSATNRLRRLEQGVVDLVIATMGDTLERRQISDLVQPHYYASGVNLLAKKELPFRDWGEMRGRPVCLTDGAYFNRTLTERYLVEPVVLSGTRDVRLALRDGRCAGWAFDDTVLAQILLAPEWQGYHMAMPMILRTPWAIGVKTGEGDAALGRFVADVVADWHASGWLIELQAKWGLPENDYLVEQNLRWSASEAGSKVCVRGKDDGKFPPQCLYDEVVGLAGTSAELPEWAVQLRSFTMLDLTPLFDGFSQKRILDAIWLTVAISVVSIGGSLGIGVLFAWIDRAVGRGMLSHIVRVPLRAFISVARMTPPILQLYIVFFGLGALLASNFGISLGSFLVASVVFSFYAGSTNTVLLSSELAHLREEHPDAPTYRLIPAAIERSYEALVSTSVNIVKAAGLASTIALAETISVTNSMIAEGADSWTMMNLLLIFYFLFVLTVLGLLKAAKGLVVR